MGQFDFFPTNKQTHHPPNPQAQSVLNLNLFFQMFTMLLLDLICIQYLENTIEI